MFSMNEKILIAENITSAYGKKEILKDVSISVNQEEIVSLIGANGAGKSTLLKNIIGFLKVLKGRIIFEGKDITEFSVHHRSNLGIGYLKQGGAVFTNLSVKENLLIATENITYNKDALFEKVFEIFPDLKKYTNTRAGLLSGGLKQMLSIAMILSRKPKIMLLDEPSAGLSPFLVKAMIEKIKEINEKEKISVLMVEQNIRQAIKISHRVYVMKNGRITREEKNPAELLKEENFKKIFFEN